MRSIFVAVVAFWLLFLAGGRAYALPAVYQFRGTVDYSNTDAFGFQELQVPVGTSFLGSFIYDSTGRNPQLTSFSAAFNYGNITGLNQENVWTVAFDPFARLGTAAPDQQGFDTLLVSSMVQQYAVYGGVLRSGTLHLDPWTQTPSILSGSVPRDPALLLQGPAGALTDPLELARFTVNTFFGASGSYDGIPWDFGGPLSYLAPGASPIVFDLDLTGAPVPEPGTVLLLAGGLSYLLGYRHRSSRGAAR